MNIIIRLISKEPQKEMAFFLNKIVIDCCIYLKNTSTYPKFVKGIFEDKKKYSKK